MASMTTQQLEAETGAGLDPEPPKPFEGVVLCCTSIPVDLRTAIASKVTELGGVHKNDLTREVTHLVVGDYNTPKYRHVAYERPDIQPMCAGWVDAVRDLWTADLPIDMVTLEKEYRLRTLEAHGGLPAGPDGPVERGRLLCSVTGFEEATRQNVINMIVEQGGIYSGDLTRSVTHLIVNKPEGKKYAAALAWGVKTVSVEWLRDCAERGMILDETKYDPRLPEEERGRGAWVKSKAKAVSSFFASSFLGKRQREGGGVGGAERNGQRKLRRVASKKLSVQRDSLWGDILGKSGETQQMQETGRETSTGEEQNTPVESGPPTPSNVSSRPSTSNRPNPPTISNPPHPQHGGVLSSSLFYIHGFPSEKKAILANAVQTMDGTVVTSLSDLVSAASDPSSATRPHIIVPQQSSPDTHPSIPPNSNAVILVTEFFVEQCLHKKRYPDLDTGAFGRPFPRFPIAAFADLAVATAGFTGVDLNQVDKTVRQLGARYEERFTAHCSVLVVTALADVRKQKLELALSWKVPVVRADWLWACIRQGECVAVADYLFPPLRQEGLELKRTKATQPRQTPQPLTVPTMVAPSPQSMFVTQNPVEPEGEEPPEEPKAQSPKEPPEPAAPSKEPPREPPKEPYPEKRQRHMTRVVSEIADSAAGDSDDPIEDVLVEKVQLQLDTRPSTVRNLHRSATTSTTTNAITTKNATARRQRQPLGRVASEGGIGLGPGLGTGTNGSYLAAAQAALRISTSAAATSTTATTLGLSIGELMQDRSASSSAVDAVGDRSIRDVHNNAPEKSKKNENGKPSDNPEDTDPAQRLAPTQVQVQYLDPEADRYRAQLMRKILGPDVLDERTLKARAPEGAEGVSTANDTDGAGGSVTTTRTEDGSRSLRRSSRRRS